MSSPVINITRAWDAVGNPQWHASVQVDEGLALFDAGATPLDAMAGLATQLAEILQRDRELRKQEQNEADLRESW